jgi:hypothetical protein
VRTARNIAALKAAGHDTLGLVIEFCRANKLEMFFSHRINDIHDALPDGDWLLSKWKRDNPKLLMGTPSDRKYPMNDPRYWWSALDFEKPEALDYLARIQEDVCSRYDVDGAEIDYFRSPMFFRPNLEFKPATPAQVESMTDFQRRLRDIHLAASAKWGRPLLTAARVPATPAACLHVGIDIKRWLQDGLIDLLTVGGGYVPFTEPIDEIVRLAHRYGIPAYPTISASGMRGPEGRYDSVEAWRGAAANMWRAGADGILTFNIFPSGPEPRFTDIGSPETLVGRDKLFVIDPVRMVEGDLAQGVVQGQVLPLPISGDGEATSTILPIGDDLPAAAKTGTLAGADLRIRLGDPKAVGTVKVRLNGALQDPVQQNQQTGWLVFKPQAEHYRLGGNKLSFRAANPSPEVRALTDVTHVEVKVVYK